MLCKIKKNVRAVIYYLLVFKKKKVIDRYKVKKEIKKDKTISFYNFF